MHLKKAYAVYFSPTGTTEKAVTAAAEGTGLPVEKVDLTPRDIRQSYRHDFAKDELVIAGLPVYAGRLPLHLDDFFAGLNGSGAPAIALVMYGNREYEDALMEVKIKLEERGFKVIAGAAFIGQHTFSKNIAGGRPDVNDLKTAGGFGEKAVKGIAQALSGKLTVKGNHPATARGMDPAKPSPIDELIKIKATADCTGCGLCADACPWGAISVKETAVVDHARCFRCLRCLPACPVSALQINNPAFDEFVVKFEERLKRPRKEPEFFFGG